MFNPPRLNQVATGFSQDMTGVSFYAEPNVIINNAVTSANASGTTVSITDDGFSVDGAFTYTGRKDNISGGTTQNRTGRVGSSDAQVTGTIDGIWKFNESNPNPNNSNLTAANGSSNIVNSTGIYNGYNSPAGAAGRTGAPTSPQSVFSFTQYQQDIGVAQEILLQQMIYQETGF